MLDRLIFRADRMALLGVRLGGAMILFAALMVSADVLTRRLFGVTIGGSDEISGYLFAIATAMALPYTVLSRPNVRIDALYGRLTPRLRAGLDLVALLALGAFALLVVWRAGATVAITWTNGSRAITPLQTPLIVPQLLWYAGWLAFAATVLLMIAAVVRALARGDLAAVQKMAGAMTQDEEVAGETGDLLPLMQREAH